LRLAVHPEQTAAHDRIPLLEAVALHRTDRSQPAQERAAYAQHAVLIKRPERCAANAGFAKARGAGFGNNGFTSGSAGLGRRAMIKKIEDLNYYELLEVSPKATSQEIHKAYERVRRVYEPNS
jgi:hypothetical protein